MNRTREDIRNQGYTKIENNRKHNSIYLSKITLNLGWLNYPIKKNRLAKWIKCQDQTLYYIEESHFGLRTHIKRTKG